MRTFQSTLLTLAILCGSGWLGAAEATVTTNRSASLQALCARLGIGPGAVVGDIGCGDGGDSMVFASIVGERGTVLAEEIDTAKLKNVLDKAQKGRRPQIIPVLGQSDDPRLPDGLADLLYTCRVFHHFSRPRAMLERMWADLRPGGFLVVVDQKKGPLTDWTPMDKREKEHHWTSETAVVRLAREAGFLFHGVLEDVWHEKDPFVLAFRKPKEPVTTKGDPDPARPLNAPAMLRALPLPQQQGLSITFCGLDQSRVLVPALQQALPPSGRFFDIVPDEWALSREEAPAEGAPPGVELLRPDKGALPLPEGTQLGLVVFADAYHRLWEPLAVLKQLKARLAPSARLVVMDRKGPEGEPRRLAGHHRRISPKQVIEEMNSAGFRLVRAAKAPAKDRFLLLFGPDEPNTRK